MFTALPLIALLRIFINSYLVSITVMEQQSRYIKQSEFGNLLADITRFADTHDDNFTFAGKRPDNCVDSEDEGLVELVAHGLKAGDLDIENFARAGEMIHYGGKLGGG